MVNKPRTDPLPNGDDIDPDELTGGADRYSDELDAEARSLGYDGAGDSGFRWSRDPHLKPARRQRRQYPDSRACADVEDDE